MDKQIKIDFLASAKGLDDIYAKIKEIKNMKGVQIGAGLQKQFSQLDAMVPALQQKLQALSSKEDLNLIDVEQIDRDFQQITRGFQRALKELSSSLPREISANLEKAKQAIADIDKQIKSSKGKISTRENKLITNDSGKTTLTDTEANKVFKQQKAPAIKDNEIASFEQYKQKFEELRKTQQLSKEEEKQIRAAIQQTEAAIKQKTTVLQTEIAAEQNKIAAYQKDRDQAVINKQNVEEQIRNNQQLTQQQQTLTNSVINASNQVSNAEAKQAQASEAATRAIKKEEKALQQKKDSTSTATATTEANTKAQQMNNSTVAKAAKQVFSYGTVLMLFRRIYSTVTNTVKEMDKALTGMAVVTNMTREQTWELVGSFQELANQTGKTTTEIANMATKFFQQGKSLTQVLKLTEAAAKAATIAGIDGSRSIDLLTNAMNGFQMSATNAMEVSDKFAALAASAATDYEELATALSKVAAQANLAGMSMDFTLGLLTKGIEVTREAPETIGTALKTVIARMRELTDYGATLEDGIDVNRVAKALTNIGVQLMDTNGQFRDLEAVLTEVGKKWNTLNKNQQANVAVALAGTRQQSRLIAMMQDFDRTLELVDISANSYGATLAQSSKYMGGLEAAGAKLKTTMEGLITSIVNSDTIIGIVDTIAGLLNVVTWIVDQAWIMVPLLVIISGHLLTALDTKIKEAAYQKEVNKLTLQETKYKKEQRLEEVKARKEQIKTTLNKIKQKKLTQEEYKLELESAALEAERNNNIALAAKYRAQAAAEAFGEAETQALEVQLQSELNMLTAEENLLKHQIAQTDMQIAQQTGLLPGIFGTLLTGLTGFLSILSIIPGIIRLIIGLRQKEGKVIDENTNKEKKGFLEKVKGAVASAAKSVAANPFWGWAVAIALLAGIGIAIAAAAGAFKSTGEKTDDSIAQTKEELNQLQAELYNLNAAKQNVAKLGDEFESLSNKIIKTNEDLERMNEIAQQINDEAGRTIVDTTADADTQLQQIRAYNIEQRAKIDSKNAEINETLGQGLVDAMDAAWVGGESAQNDAKDKYYESLKNDSAFINSLRTVGMANLEGMQDVSAATSDTILDIMVSNVDSEQYFSEDGLDTAAFEQYVTDALQDSSIDGYSGFIAQLDAIVADGSMTAYADMLDDLGTSSDENFNKLMDSLKESNPMFAAVAEMGTDAARKFDEIGFSGDELNTMWDKLKKSSKALGKDTGKTFAEMAKNIEAIGDIDNDGVISDLEARQAMYKQLVQEQLDAAAASQAIVDGTDKETEAAIKYNQNLTDLATKQGEIATKQTELENAQNASKPDENKIEELQEDMDELTSEAAELEGEINAVKDAATNCYTNIEDLKSILGITSAKEITEEFTKLSSAMERVSKITDIASMSLADQMELLTDYPELLAAVERGYLTASEAAGLYRDTMNSSLEDIKANKSNYALIYSEDGGAQLKASQMGEFSKLFDDSEAGRLARKQFLDMGTLSEDDPWVKQMLAAYEEYGFKTKKEMLDYLNGVKADVEEYNKQDYLDQQLSNGDYTAIMSEEDKEAWSSAIDKDKQRRNQIDQLNSDIEFLEEGTQEYVAAISSRNALLVRAIDAGNNKLASVAERTKQILAVKSDDEELGFLQDTGLLADGSIEELIKYENGVAQLNYDVLDSLELTEEEVNKVKAYMSTVVGSLNNLAEEEQETAEQIKADQELLAQSIIDSEAKAIEAQIENLEKRKEAYEEYFDAIDKLSEEEERASTLEDITNQLSALAGGSDAATNSLRKDLMSQMEDLKKEEEDARKEAAREALISDIESQTEQLNTQLDGVNNSLNKIIALMSNPNYKMQIDDNGNITVVDANGNNVLPFANGGLVDYTGPAIVHGSPNAPEAFLSAQDTKNMQLLFAALNDVVAKSTAINVSGEDSGLNNIAIENINITTQQLNNDQDFRTAGQIFAEEFGKAIRQRGLNVNVKK